MLGLSRLPSIRHRKSSVSPSATTRRHLSRRTLRFEPLEARQLLAAGVAGVASGTDVLASKTLPAGLAEAPLTTTLAPASGTLAKDDFNGDGISDVLLQDKTTGEVGAWLVKNGGAPNDWKEMGVIAPGAWNVVGVGDFDGNGISDVLLHNQVTGEVAAWLIMNNAPNGWKSMGIAPAATWKVVGTGDFDGNGLSDVLLQDQTTGGVGAWLIPSASGINGWKDLGIAPVATWKVLGTGDFDHNGLSDVLLQNLTSGEVGAWLVQSGNTLNGWISMGFAPTATWKVVGVGDYDTNGFSDVLLHNQGSGEVGAWLIQSGGAPNIWRSMGIAPVATWSVVGTGDYDAGGSSDVLLHDQTSGEIGAWLIQNGSVFNTWKSLGIAPVASWKVLPDNTLGLQATSLVSGPLADAATLSPSDLQPIVAEAIARWAAAGLDAATLAKLSQVHFVISDLPGSDLGQADGTLVYLDSNAAGHGWFVDATPALDEEFTPTANAGQLQAIDPRAVDRIDLLTVVEHELGHVAGFIDLDALADNLMSGVLGAGTRRAA